MAKMLLNLCLEVGTAPVTVVPAGEGTTPTEPPYWFTVYWSSSDDPTPVKGDTFPLTEDGPCRVFVWDDEPTEVPSLNGPSSQDPSIRITLEGGSASLITPERDPWPT